MTDFSREALGTLYVRRLWIVADVETCHPEGGPEAVEYVRFGNADALDAYYSAISDPLSFANTQTLHGITCPGTNTYKANGRGAGGVKCYFAKFDAERTKTASTRTSTCTWSSTPTKVLAFAISPAADERMVMDWWASERWADRRLGSAVTPDPSRPPTT